MSKERKVVYEPHPVSPERKAELIAGGYKIIDARFAPEGHKPDDDGRVPEAEQRKQLVAELKEKGIKFNPKAPTEELRALSITPAGE